MLKFDFTNLMLESVGKEDGLTHEDISMLRELTPKAHKKFKEWRTSKDALFYDIVFDDAILNGIEAKANEVAKEFDNLVVFGIGGSALGLRSLANALLPPFWNFKDKSERKNKPRLFVCDNIDPETFAGLLDLIDLKKTCFTIISKSGKTTETAAQFFIVLKKLRATLGEKWQKQVVIITDPKAGELRPFVNAEKLASFEIPPKLGGRFSALSPVGLFPAACLGIDVRGLLAGAKEMAKKSDGEKLEENIPYQLGGYHYLLDTKKQKHISVMFSYSDALSLVSDWYVQLWAESLGKEGKGQTPLKAVGPTDQHSQVQLFMEGPKDKVFTFLGTENFRTQKNATQITDVFGSFDYIKGHDLGEILHAEQKATAAALKNMGRPNLSITMPTIDAHHIGELFMTYEIATAFTGALYGINPFNQPGVELGKKLTKEMLK